MQLSKERRIARARKAGIASGNARHEKNVVRNEGLVLAFRYFTEPSISKRDAILALKFLSSIKAGANLRKGASVLVHLATAVNISKDRLQRILREAEKNV